MSNLAKMTTAQAAKESGVNVKTVRQWVHRGRIPAEKAPFANVHIVNLADVIAERNASMSSVRRGRDLKPKGAKTCHSKQTQTQEMLSL